MRKLSHTEFEQLLSEISISCLLDEHFFKQMKNRNLNPIDWPECNQKNMMIEFMAIEEIKGYSFAQINAGKDILKLNAEYIPNDPNRIYEQYKFNIDCYKFSQLGNRLLKSPEIGHELINNFKSFQKENISFFNLKDSILTTINDHVKNIKEKKAFVSLPDFPMLSKAIGGFNDSRVSIISAKSGMGKTKLAINLALSASKIMPTFFYNMEMSKNDFVSMFIQNKLGIKNEDWYSGDFLNPYSQDRILNSEELFNDHEIYFTGGESLSLSDMISSMHTKCKDAFIIVDYDQKIITEGKENEWKEILKAVENLEQVAKVTKSHVLLLAQGNEEGDIKASSRSKQPTSTVLNFLKCEVTSKYLIKSIKTRFGKSFILEVSADHSRTQMSEIGLINYKELKQKQFS